GPIAVPGWEMASVISRELAFGRPASHPTFTSRSDFDADASRAIEHFSNRSDIVFARPDSVQCNIHQCDYIHGGVPLFSDSNHLAQSQLALFRPVFEDALAKAKNQK
ncbi:MAG TPA: SGNH hydrolase domain-containing protein, partial [Xanthomonadaceae bacterium]|nr:SGNH hydrolase domain-containing protein [Xanthomonadaceae bacterium]